MREGKKRYRGAGMGCWLTLSWVGQKITMVSELLKYLRICYSYFLVLAGDPSVPDMIYLPKYFYDFTKFICQDRKIPVQSCSNTSYELFYACLFLQNRDCLNNIKNREMSDREAIGLLVGFSVIDEPLLVSFEAVIHDLTLYFWFVAREGYVYQSCSLQNNVKNDAEQRAGVTSLTRILSYTVQGLGQAEAIFAGPDPLIFSNKLIFFPNAVILCIC